MKLLAVSDLHGSLNCIWTAIEATHPDVLLCCGDWGDPDEVELSDLEPFSERLPVYTVYGNHDHLEALREWQNKDGSDVLLPHGEALHVGEVTLAGISGIWAKSHRKPYYITDEEVEQAALAVSASGKPVDILLTHGCPSGVADLTWQNRHGGQKCFLHAFQLIRPRVYLTGHLHRAQEYRTKDGALIRNLGQTPRGEATLITVEAGELKVEPLMFD